MRRARPASLSFGVRSAAIEQHDPERRLERLHGLAHRRLYAAELPRSGREATAVGHGDEDTQLIEGEPVKHDPSVPMMDYITILPILKMDRSLYMRGIPNGTSQWSVP